MDKDVISNVDFINSVSEANFRSIYDHAVIKKSKHKTKYIICILSKFTGNEWYLKAAHSIDTEPNKCSGATVPYDWKKKAGEIR